MNNSYVIQWKSKVNGRAGRGTKQFEKGEAEQLVQELNHEYPQIEHEAIPATAAEAEPVTGAAISNTPTPVLSPA
jgi:hypothetical protein